MAITDRFRHRLVIHRLQPGGDTDGRGNRVDTWEPSDPVPGLVMPWKPSREFRGIEPEGVGVVDSIGFLTIGTVVGPADYIVPVADEVFEGDEVFEVIGPAQNAGGRGRHLELDLHEVTP